MAEINEKIAWPGWETVRLIGSGSFGEVYEIERDVLGEKEKAALKVITIPRSSSDIDELASEGYDGQSITSTFKAYLKSIVAEYSLMRKMNGSANVVNCDDVRYVQHDDGYGWDIFIKMELLTPLNKAVGKDVTDEQVIRIGTDICKALVLCKKHNIIHRDIKPANIFVSENGDYKLGDFGIAKTVEQTTGGTKIGTYDYMAPEVYHDQPYGSTADIYSLGMVLYWLLNERRSPFLELPPALPTKTDKEQARKRRFQGERIPEPEHGSDELKRIVLKAVAFDSRDRYQSAEEMLKDLMALTGEVYVGPEETSQNSDNAGDDPQEALQPEEAATVTGTATVGAFDNKPEPVQKKSKRPLVLGVTAALALFVIGFFTVHIWEPATCEEPEICKICKKSRGEALGHAWGAWSVAAEATCTEHGMEQRVCERNQSHIETREIAAAGHKWLNATCTEPAICEICGAESDGPIGHDWGAPSYTWSADNGSVLAKRVCKNDATHVETEIGKTTGEVVKEATCTENGQTRYSVSFTNSAFSSQTKRTSNLPATGHDWGEVSYLWDSNNLNATAKRVCKNDSNHVEKETVKAASKVTKPATCSTKGSTTYTAAFQNSAFAEQSKTVNNIAAKGHDWGSVRYTWSADNKTVTATRTCKNDASHVESETVKSTSRVSKPATCSTKGSTTYTAAFQNSAFAKQTKTVENISAKGHSWGVVKYTWSADNKTVTATRTCKNDASHVESETVKTTSRVSKPATCSTKGSTTYKATFQNSAFAEETKTVNNVAAKGHSWGVVKYTWSADNKTITATRTCKNDASHVESETVKTTSRVSKPATCTSKGKTRYTAAFQNSAFAKQTKTVENISAKGHRWGEVSYVWDANNRNATAKRICKNDSTHVERETVKTTSQVTTAATCKTKGKTTYTASFSNRAFTKQTKTVTDVPLAAHSWKAATYDSPKTCRVCGKQEGDPKGVRRNIEWDWGDRLNIHGNFQSSAHVFKEPVKNCMSITMTVTLYDVVGDIFGEYFFFGRGLDGKWMNLGKFELLKENKDKSCTYEIKMDGTKSFDAVAFTYVYDRYGWSFSHTCSFDVQEYIG